MDGISSTFIIIAITCVVSFVAFGNPKVMDELIFWPPAVTRKHDYSRFIGYGLVHANGSHLLFNMMTLYFFGRTMEGIINAQLGAYGFGFFYVLGLIVSILPTYFQHRDDENYRSLGASGAVSAVLFAYILFQPWSMIYFYFALPIPAIVYAVLYVGYTIWANRRGGGRINHSAHLWGAAYGVAFVLVMKPEVLSLFVGRLMHPGFGR
jgi:membrane associated rhomboid family serine protease